LILESLDNAISRKAKIYGEVLGYGITCDSFHMTAPDEQASGAVRSMQAALKDSGLSIDDIDYINATARLLRSMTSRKLKPSRSIRKARLLDSGQFNQIHACAHTGSFRRSGRHCFGAGVAAWFYTADN